LTEEEQIDVERLKLNEQTFKSREEILPENFVEENFAMINSIALSLIQNKKVPPCIELNDLIGWGIEGLLKAKKKFKENKGSQFSTYAFYRVRGEMLDMVRKEWKYRNPSEYDVFKEKIHDRISEVSKGKITNVQSKEKIDLVEDVVETSGMVYMLSMDGLEIPSDASGTLDPEIEHVDQSDGILVEELDKLDDDERKILELIYTKDMKQKSVASFLGLSNSTVSRIHLNILKKLRRNLSKRYNE
jgi:RNA polymerase sigma factor for flagellar operon FliA